MDCASRDLSFSKNGHCSICSRLRREVEPPGATLPKQSQHCPSSGAGPFSAVFLSVSGKGRSSKDLESKKAAATSRLRKREQKSAATDTCGSVILCYSIILRFVLLYQSVRVLDVPCFPKLWPLLPYLVSGCYVQAADCQQPITGTPRSSSDFL